MRTLTFYHPGKKFPSLSVTGEQCNLACRHCQGHFLKNMIDVSTPEKLRDTANRLVSEGANGFLLSGGFDKGGKVPLDGYYGVLKDIKRKTDLLVNVHTGLLDKNTAENLRKAGVDVVSYDMIGSSRTIKEVYGMDASPSDFENGYKLLIEEGLDVVPHITLGLHAGRIEGEHRALEIVKASGRIIINSLVPTFWGKSVQKDDIIKFLKTACKITDSELVLGCMRERGRHGLEIESIRSGIDGIVNPSRKTRKWVRARYDIIEKELCCSF
ncbi:MAG: radical SAM protein [Candidatus Saliniplasma sp.]